MAKDKHKVKPPIGRANGILLVVSILLIVGAVLMAGYTSIMNWTPLAEVEETVNSDGSTVQGSVATIDEDIKTPESEAGPGRQLPGGRHRLQHNRRDRRRQAAAN